MFRRTLLASVGAIALTGSAAFAADLPSRAPPPVYLPPPPLWTGLYVGINAGYTWGNSNSLNFASIPVATATNASAFGVALANTMFAAGNNTLGVNDSGFIGGGQIGYNYQLSNAFVVGIEADIQGSTAKGSANAVTVLGVPPPAPAGVTVTTAFSASKHLDYLGTVRGRLGYLFTPTLLVYGTGGLAYGGAQASASVAQTVAPFLGFTSFPSAAGNFSNTRVGWTAGGGLEWLFAPNWSAKVEYLYYDIGTVTQAFGPLTSVLPGALPNNVFSTATAAFSTRFNGNVVRAGLNYHFNWGGAPIVAKY